MADDDEDFHIRVTADMEEAGRAFDDLDDRIEESAEDGEENIGRLDKALGRFGATAARTAVGFGALLASTMVLVRVLREAMERAGEVRERASELAPRLGDEVEESVGSLNQALSELQAAFTATFFGGLGSAAESTIGQFLNTLAERATAAARAVQGVVEGLLPLEERSNAAIEARIAALDRLIAAERAVPEAQREAIRRAAEAVGGYVQTLEQLLAERARLAAELEGRELEFGHMESSEVERQITALERRNLQLRIQAETFGMAAAAAARYRREQELLQALEESGTERSALTREQQERLAEAIEEEARLAGILEARRVEQRLLSGEGQVQRLEQQVRALGLSAGEAARLNFEERTLLSLRQARLPVDEETLRNIREMARRAGELTEVLQEQQRQMRIIEANAQLFSSSLERAFTGWISGTETSWRRFFNALARDLATLTLRQQILQPLFGGGGVQGGGLIGSLLSGILGGGIGPWTTTVIPARQHGGPVSAGMPYMVGEGGPELFIPDASGTVVPGGAGAASIHMTVDLTGANGDETIARIAKAYAAAGAREAIEESNRQFPARQRNLHLLGS